MRKILLIVGLTIGAWYYFVGGRKLDEQDVREFYQAQTYATLSRDPERLCKQLHADFRGEVTTVVSGRGVDESMDRDHACKSTQQVYEQIELIGNQLGGTATLDYENEIRGITLADDGREATVETSFSMDVAGAVMRLRGTNTDTLVKRNGRVLLLKSKTKARLMGG